MTRLLFIGLWNFADDGGVQPLRPRTFRIQVFPGDEIDNEAVRAMIDELAARGLVRLYSVEGQDYVAIIDWEQIQRVGKRARRRFPGAETIANHINPSLRPSALDEGLPRAAPATETMANHSNPPPASREAACRSAIDEQLRQDWPSGRPADTERWIGQRIAEGCDLEHDVLPAISEVCLPAADRDPPAGLHEVAASIAANRARRLAVNGVVSATGAVPPQLPDAMQAAA